MFGHFGQRFSLVIVGFFVNVNVIDVPTAERFKHAFAFGALDELGHRETVKGCFAVLAFADEDDLCAVAGHSGGQGSEPATAWGIAGAGFFEIAGDFPRDFGGGRVGGLGG